MLTHTNYAWFMLCTYIGQLFQNHILMQCQHMDIVFISTKDCTLWYLMYLIALKAYISVCLSVDVFMQHMLYTNLACTAVHMNVFTQLIAIAVPMFGCE